jgi:pyridoxine kinase
MMDATTTARMEPKAVLAISSQVARGSVGLRAAGFALERLGHQVWKVPTIWMPWHPGHAKSLGLPPRSVTPDDVFATSLEALTATPVIDEVGAILTGYFASAGQVKAACRAIDAVRKVTPDVLVVCDPVSADSHGTYVPVDVVAALREELLPRCDLATPNRFEAAAFSRMEPATTNAELAAQARAMQVPAVVVTSAFGMMKNAMGALAVDQGKAVLVEHTTIDGAPHGTGDLFSALLTSHRMAGAPLDAAVARATSSVFEIVARSVQAGSDELLIAREQSSLVSPMAMVQTRQLMMPRAEIG